MFLKLTKSDNSQPILIRVDCIITVRRDSAADNTLVCVALGRDGLALYEVNESLEWIHQQLCMVQNQLCLMKSVGAA